jgi:2-polyprenyl-3-methyl-5-hydroxy-6-metoxy-1,4-benzoquinol methylase
MDRRQSAVPERDFSMFDASNAYPMLSELTEAVAARWPQHQKYLTKTFAGRSGPELEFSEKLARLILTLARSTEGGIEHYIDAYRFLCEDIVRPEEMHFRRTGRYRLQSFDEAYRTVYSDRAFMTKYMDGLLLSDCLWFNHALCMKNYRLEFLPRLAAGASLLEIGPGHGLLLYLAQDAGHLGTVSAWDVSETSLSLAAHALRALGAPKPVDFALRNIFDADIMSSATEGLFDAVVLSEVLEHLENPLGAIEVLYHLTKPEGLVWINLPANSPAPDHLYLVTDLAQPVELVKQAGFEIVDAVAYPMSGATMESAMRRQLTFSCVITGRKPA